MVTYILQGLDFWFLEKIWIKLKFQDHYELFAAWNIKEEKKRKTT